MRILWLVSLMLIVPVSAPAFDCTFFMECCNGYHAAMVEGGASPEDLLALEATCDVPNQPSQIPISLNGWCAQTWYIIGDLAYEHWIEGHASYYPESCPADPTGDPDEVMPPDNPEYPDPGAPPPESS